MFTALLALALAPTQGDGVPLKWNLKPGDTFYAKTATAIDLKLGVVGQMIDQKQDINVVTKFTVKAADGKTTVIEMAFMEMKLTGVLGSDAVTDKVKGGAVTATLDDKMKVTKLDGQAKLVADAKLADPTAAALLAALLSEDALRQMVTTLFAFTPDKPVKAGDAWEKADDLDAGGIGKVSAKFKYKLAKVEADTATIDATADLSFKPGDGAGLPFKIVKADLKFEKYAAAHQFDVKAGRLKEATSELTTTGTMTINVMGMDLDATVSQKLKSTTTVSDKP